VPFNQPLIGSQLVGILLNTYRAILFHSRTGWEIFAALVIPSFLAAGGLIIKSHHVNPMTGHHARNASEIAEEQQNESVFQAYLDKMTELLLKENLRDSKMGSEIRSIARARTITTLLTQDPIRKGKLLRFLFETNLNNKENNILDLSYADLSRADLVGAYLIQANLDRAFLSGSDLSRSNLVGVNLVEADLREASLNDAHLSRANLSRADLTGADLRKAFLIGANLNGANLSGADLRGANLRDAKVTEDQLSEAKSLEGAIMPDGKNLGSRFAGYLEYSNF